MADYSGESSGDENMEAAAGEAAAGEAAAGEAAAGEAAAGEAAVAGKKPRGAVVKEKKRQREKEQKKRDREKEALGFPAPAPATASAPATTASGYKVCKTWLELRGFEVVENGDDGPGTVKKSLSTALSMIQRIMPDFAWAVHVDNELSAAEIDAAFNPVAADMHVKTTFGYGLQDSEFPRLFVDYSTTKFGEETISWRSATAYVFTVLMKRKYHRLPTEKETAVFWALDVATTLRNRWSTRFSRSKKKNKQEQA